MFLKIETKLLLFWPCTITSCLKLSLAWAAAIEVLNIDREIKTTFMIIVGCDGCESKHDDDVSDKNDNAGSEN